MSGGSVYATSVVLWAFDGDIGLGSIALKVYLSDGGSAISTTYYDEEYSVSRKPGNFFPEGYYRFSVYSCYYNGGWIYFEDMWTDWYYLSNSIYYVNGVRSGD